MAVVFAVEWLRGPLRDISGLVNIVSSFCFQFRGVPVRELPRESTSTITCVVCLSDAWAVGDSDGNVSVYDSCCEQLLRTDCHGYPVYTVASFGDNGFVCNAKQGFWVRHKEKTWLVPSEEAHCIFKLASFPDGTVASCSKLNGVIRIYDLHAASPFLRVLLVPGRVSDIVQCSHMLASVHETEEPPFNVVVWLWDARQGTVVHTIPLQYQFVYNVVAAENKLAFIDPQMRAHVYNLETNRSDVMARTYRLCTIPDGRFLVTSTVDDAFRVVETSACGVNNEANSEANSEVKGEADEVAFRAGNICCIMYTPAGYIISCKYNKIAVWK